MQKAYCVYKLVKIFEAGSSSGVTTAGPAFSVKSFAFINL